MAEWGRIEFRRHARPFYLNGLGWNAFPEPFRTSHGGAKEKALHSIDYYPYFCFALALRNVLCNRHTGTGGGQQVCHNIPANTVY